MSEYLKIGEVAELKGISIRTLRFYDRVGLVKPAYVDPNTNYRYYSMEQLFHIEMIMHLRGLGVPINDLKFLFDNDGLDIWQAYLKKVMSSTAMQIEKLKEALIKTEKFIGHIEAVEEIKDNESIYTLDIEERTVLTRDCDSAPSSEKGISMFQEVYKMLADEKLITTYQSGSIFGIADGEYDFKREKIFINFYCMSGKKPEGTFVIPAGEYVCINHKWVDFEEKKEKLMRYITENKLEAKMMIEEEAFLDFSGYMKPLASLQVLI